MKTPGTVFAVPLGMRIALFASLLLAVACGDDEGLTISGSLQVDADGAVTGFDFPEETRLIDLAREEDTGSQMAGRCSVTGEDVELMVRAPGAPPEGLGLHRVELSIPAEGASGYAVAQLGSDEYSAALGAGCTAEILEREDGGSEVEIAVDCELEGPDSATATLTADFEIEGCIVD